MKEDKSEELNGTGLEERADYLNFAELQSLTADHPYFARVRDKLFERGAKLIVGPRGTGKTHQMRLAYLQALDDKSKPIAIYVSFNRYYHLEPLLHKAPHARQIFHTWVLCRIILACLSAHDDYKSRSNSKIVDLDFGIERLEIIDFVAQAEKGLVPNNEILVLSEVTISSVLKLITSLSEKTKRNRSVIFLDDAALSLTPDYMIEFFDIYRTIKTSTISPKASVYPGTTQYGPRFHVRHDAETVDVWLNVVERNYSEVMQEVFDRRFGDAHNISAEVVEMFKFASFGVPRVFLTMIRSFEQAEGANQQQKINSVLSEQTAQLYAEFESLVYKLPQFETIIKTGSEFHKRLIKDLTAENKLLENTKQLFIGIQKDADVEKTLVERMIKLLIEAGLIYPHLEVSHGEDRDYLRYTPHLAILIQNGAFRITARGTSPKDTVSFLSRANAKHPLRRRIRVLLGESIDSLAPDLPPCQKCSSIRLSESQNFCHICGEPLVTQSSFEECMRMDINMLPLTSWLKNTITQQTRIKLVADFLSIQDPASELQKAKGIGKIKSARVIGKVTEFIEEFLS